MYNVHAIKREQRNVTAVNGHNTQGGYTMEKLNQAKSILDACPTLKHDLITSGIQENTAQDIIHYVDGLYFCGHYMCGLDVRGYTISKPKKAVEISFEWILTNGEPFKGVPPFMSSCQYSCFLDYNISNHLVKCFNDGNNNYIAVY